jgi:hypothetical protein
MLSISVYSSVITRSGSVKLGSFDIAQIISFYSDDNILTGGRLTKNQLIEIVFFQLIESFNNELIQI